MAAKVKLDPYFYVSTHLVNYSKNTEYPNKEVQISINKFIKVTFKTLKWFLIMEHTF